MASTPLIEMRDISIAFGGIKAVDHASIDLNPGEVVGLLGHNGAGKSTLIKILSGAYRAIPDRSSSRARKSRSTTRAMPRRWASRRSTRRSRWPTMSMPRRTSILGRELRTPFGTLDDVAMEAETRKVMHRLNPQLPPLQGAGHQAVGRPAPVGGHCARHPLQRPHPDHGRADRGAGPAGNRAGGRAHQAAESRRHRHLPDQP
jgi:ABC-type sugar transport system ATPase subunit